MSQQQSTRSWLIIAILVILGLTAGLGLGLIFGWVVMPVEYVDTTIAELDVDYKEDYILLVAAAYSSDGDLEKAKVRLALLEAPNIGQWVADLIDRYITEGRHEQDIQALVALARGLGVDNPNMIAYVVTPTLTPTDLPSPTPTPVPTNTPIPTLVPPTAVPATMTPIPTDTPPPAPPTATSVPLTSTPLPPTVTSVPPTQTPAPPTNTPKPRPSNTPKPPPKPTNTPQPAKPQANAQFSIVESRMLHINENSGCMGNHNIFVEVRDAGGAPLSNVAVCGYWALQIGTPGACKIAGVTDDKPPGWAEFVIYSSGDQIYIASDPNGQGALSPLSDSFSTMDDAIPNSWLINAGYCDSEQDCQTRKAQGQLCQGHYSYKVVFQRNQ